MSILTRKTARMLVARSAIAMTDLLVEAQKLTELCQDPKVPAEQKAIAMAELDDLIERLEKRTETARRLRGEQPKEAE